MNDDPFRARDDELEALAARVRLALTHWTRAPAESPSQRALDRIGSLRPDQAMVARDVRVLRSLCAASAAALVALTAWAFAAAGEGLTVSRSELAGPVPPAVAFEEDELLTLASEPLVLEDILLGDWIE